MDGNAQDEDKAHVPYRDSKLTRLLKDSLSGNSFTALLAHLNPLPEHYEECQASLQFALRCTTITTVPHVNFVTAGTVDNALIDSLAQQVRLGGRGSCGMGNLTWDFVMAGVQIGSWRS